MKYEITTAFFRQALAQEKPLRKALGKLIGLVEQHSLLELTKHKGAHLEKVEGLFDPHSGNPIYSLRITLSARATAIVRDGALVFLSVHPDHDGAYN